MLFSGIRRWRSRGRVRERKRRDAVAEEKESAKVSKKVSKNQQEIFDAIAKNPSGALDELL